MVYFRNIGIILVSTILGQVMLNPASAGDKDSWRDVHKEMTDLKPISPQITGVVRDPRTGVLMSLAAAFDSALESITREELSCESSSIGMPICGSGSMGSGSGSEFLGGSGSTGSGSY